VDSTTEGSAQFGQGAIPGRTGRYNQGSMKYAYSTLRVMCYHSREYRVDQMREAVEYLKTQPQTEFTGLQARTSTTAGPYKLQAEPRLPLDKILGKTPAQVWDMFDAEVDRWRKGLLNATGERMP